MICSEICEFSINFYNFLHLQAARNAEIAAVSGASSPTIALKVINTTDDATSVLFGSLKEGSSMDVENIAGAVMFLDASYGCVLQSTTTPLTDSDSTSNVRLKVKKEWSRDVTVDPSAAAATTAAATSDSPAPTTRTSSDTNTDGTSPLIAKEKQSQRPGVFDINTGSTAFPISASALLPAPIQAVRGSIKVRLLHDLP